MPTCSRCGEEHPALARFCPACGTALVVEEVEARRLVTVLFADLVGSTALGELLEPEQIRRVLTLYGAEARTVVERYQGTAEKFIGDAVMAVFGLPVVHEDDALRAVRAALDLREAVAALNVELEHDLGVTIQTRTGINSGEVVSGDPSRGERLVTGDVVNVAKRLEETAGSGEILIGAETHRLIRDAVVAEPTAPIAARGKTDPLSAYRVVDVTPGALSRTRRLDSPMVDRTDEFDLLRETFERVVRERRCELLTVLGAAGVGKSRLAAEALAQLEGTVEILAGSCLPYGEGITLWPLIEVVRRAAGITDVDTTVEARMKIASAVADDDAADLVAERLEQVLGLSADTARSHDIFWALRRMLEARARRRPIVVLLDDIHWGEQAFLDLVGHLPDWSNDAPILILCMARPELLDVRPGWVAATKNASVCLLQPLGEEDTRTLIDNLAGEVDDAILRRILETAEGNPLFVEQMLEMLTEDGMADSKVPSTIQVLLAARLDRLDPGERRVLEYAAVEGAEFHAGAVAALAGPEPIADALFGLVRKDLVRPHPAAFTGEDGFRFRHVLFRDASYNGLPKARRADLHARYADWLEVASRERRLEYEELLGYHCEQASRYRSAAGRRDETTEKLSRRAFAHLGSAGRRALARGDMTAAANLLERATALLPDGSPERSDILIDLGAALGETTELNRAAAVLEEAIDVAEREGRGLLAVRARVELSYLRLHLDPTYSMDEAAGVAQHAVAAFEQAGDELGLSRALQHLALVHWARCRLSDMNSVLEDALVHAERAGDGRGVSEILDGLCRAALLGPDPVDRGIRRCKEILGRAAGDLRLQATVDEVLAMLLSMQGRFDDARILLGRAAATFGELGLIVRRATVATYAAFVELYAGDARAAELWLRDAYQALEEMGERSRFSTVAALLAQALCQQGRVDEADACTIVSEQSASPADAVSQVIWRLARGKVLTARGRLGEAEMLCRDAVARTEETDFSILRGDALVALADVVEAAGRIDEVEHLLDRAAGLYTAKGNVISARAVAARLHAAAP